MRRAFVLVMSGLIAIVVATGAARAADDDAGGRIDPSTGVCRTVDDPPDDDGAAAETEAKRFLAAVLGDDPADAFGQLSAAGRAGVSDAQFAAVTSRIRASGPFAEPTVAAAYILDVTPGSDATVRIACPGPSGSAFAAARPSARQAHVFLKSAVKSGETTFSLWLEVEDGAWRVVNVRLDPSQMAGHDGWYWWAKAKAQRAAGHPLNAALLYLSARALIDRGPNFQAAGWAEFDAQAARYAPPAELRTAGLSWRMNGASYTVLNVTAVGVAEDQLAMAIVQQQRRWTDDEEADAENHAFIDAFNMVHPEWTQAFQVLAVRTCPPDASRCFGSLYDKDKGYLGQPPAAPTAPPPSDDH